MARLGTAYVDVVGNFAPLNRQLAVRGRLRSQLAGFAKVGAAATAGIGIAAIKSATDFSQAMTRVQTQAGASGKEVDKLRGQVLKLAKSSEFSPKALADGLFRVESAGFRGAKAMQILNKAQQLASVGGSDLEQTTNALVGAMNSHIKGTESAAKTTGTLNAAIGLGNMRMDDMVGALSTGILPAAKTFGLSLRDVTSAIDVMTKSGVPAQAAATRLRMTFSLMAAPTSKAADALKTIGLTSTSLAVEMRKPGGLVKAVTLLRDHLSGLSKVKQAQVLSHIFGGGRTSAAIMSLVQNVGDLGKVYDATGRKAGEFGADVKKQSEEPAARFKVAMNQIKTELVQIGSKLAPKASKEIEKLAKILGDDRLTTGQKFSKLGDELSRVISQAVPKIANAAAKVAPKVAAGFVKGFLHAGIWGQLAIGAFLVHKFGSFRGLFGVGAAAGGQVATGVEAGMLKSGAPARGFKGMLGRLAPVATRTGWLVLGAAVLNGVDKAMSDRSKRLTFQGKLQEFIHGATFGALPAAKGDFQKMLGTILSGGNLKAQAGSAAQRGFRGVFGGKGFTVGKATIDSSDLNTQSKRILGRVLGVRRALNRAAGVPIRFKVNVDPAAAIRATKTLTVNFNRLRNHLATTTGDISKYATQNMRAMAQTMDLNSTKGRKAVQANMHLSLVAVRDAMAAHDISASKGMREVRRLFEVNTKGAKDSAQHNFGLATKAIRGAMGSSTKATKEGLSEIRKLFVSYLAQFGIKGNDAAVYLSHVPKSSGGGGKPINLHHNARGGLVQFGQQGAAGRDNIPVQFGGQRVVVGSGEQGAVFNRHQIPEINARLADVGGLRGFFARNTRKHYMAEGGLVGRPMAYGGVVPALASLIKRLDAMGFHHGSTTGGKHAPGSYHYRGQAVDYGDAANNMPRLWGKVDPARMQFPELFGPHYLKPPTLMHYGKGFSDPSLQKEHNNHIHIAVDKAIKSLAGGAGGAGALAAPHIARLLLGGPASALKAIGQRGLDVTRSAANKRLASLAGSSGTAAPGKGKASRSQMVAWATQALHATGHGASPAAISEILTLAQKESGWRIDSENKTDINAQMGNPSVGLMQVTLDKVGGSRARGFDPVQNMIASIKYQFAKYGHLITFSPYAKGGLVGMAGGGLPKQLTSTIHAIAGKSPKKRSKALKGLLKKIKGVDLPKGMKAKLGKYEASSTAYGELADRAGALTQDGPDGKPILGVVKGKNEAGWVQAQLDVLFKYRNEILKAEKAVEKRRNLMSKLVAQVKRRIDAVTEQIAAKTRYRRHLQDQLFAARNNSPKQIEKAIRFRKHLQDQLFTAEKHPKKNKALIRTLHDQIHGVDDQLAARRGGKAARVRKLSGQIHHVDNQLFGDRSQETTLKSRLLPALTAKRSTFNTARGDLLSTLGEVQGPSPPAPLTRLKAWPPIGTLGGTIFDDQIRLRDLGAKPAAATDSSSTDLADTLKELLSQANLRTAVSEAQFKVFKDMPPFGGQFATGGTVPGPVGQARTIIAHGGETVTPLDQQGGDVHLVQHFAPGTEWLRDFVKVELRRDNRKTARAGSRGLPGRQGV